MGSCLHRLFQTGVGRVRIIDHDLADKIGRNPGRQHLFAVELRWLPSFGRGDVTRFGWWSTGLLTETGRKSLIMPVLTLGFFQLTLIMRLVRSEMLEAMRTDYIKFARARGIPERRRRIHA